MKKESKIKIIVLIIVVAVFALVEPLRNWVINAAKLLAKVDVDEIREYILSFGIWAPVVSFLLMVFQSVAAPLPAFLITFANASLFGWAKGAALSWSSAMVGAMVCFTISRVYGRNTVEKLTSRFALEETDKFFEKYGNYAVLIARLLPFISFDIVSYAAGLTSMGIWSFIWATGLGQLPATLVYSYVGGMLTGGTKMFVTGLLIIFAFATLLFLIKKVLNDRKKDKKVENK